MVSKDIVELQNLSREARYYWGRYQKKFPVRSAGLKLVNNCTIREWSYKGVTMASQPGSNGRRLEIVSRGSPNAACLPPTYRAAPDFRDKRARTADRKYRDTIHALADIHQRPWTSPDMVNESREKSGGPSPGFPIQPIFTASNPTTESTSRIEQEQVHYTKADSYFRSHSILPITAF